MSDLAPVYHGTPMPRRHYGATADPRGTDEKEWQRLMFEWYGLTPCGGDAWTTWASCPHAVGLGKGQRRRSECSTQQCGWTSQWHSSTLWDHARAWRNSDGRVVVTLEPYGDPFQSVDEHTELTAELDPLGITVAFEGRSPYGATYLLGLVPTVTEREYRLKATRHRLDSDPFGYSSTTF